MEYVVLVNEQDEPIGTCEKMEAHEKALLHRAFSVFLFNDKGEMLIHQRAHSKYHSPGLWTNACCSHQRPEESTLDAAHRRMQEELGIDCDIKEIFSFQYKAPFDNGLTEHELDHVLIGQYNTLDMPLNPEEVAAVKFISLKDLEADVAQHPSQYTEWFKIALPRVINAVQS